MATEPRPGQKVSSNSATYELISILSSGDTSWGLEATNGREKIFLKFYTAPTLHSSWYRAYVNYEKELNERLRESDAAQFCLLPVDTFEAPHPRPSSEYRYFFQAFEFIEAEDLSRLLETPIGWEHRKSIAKIFLMAMKKIHAAKVVHCDLKPENVQMINTSAGMGMIPRIIDMDRSIMTDRTHPWKTGDVEEQEGYAGTQGYLSPEHLLGKCPETASDVFTIGIILSELLCGMHPYEEIRDEPRLYYKAVTTGTGRTPIKLLDTLGGSVEHAQRFARLMERCFEPDPRKRPSCDELHVELLKLDVPPSLFHKPCLLRLTGDRGVVESRISLDMGRPLLENASSEARFASYMQFSLNRLSLSQWSIAPCPDTSALTTLNGQELTEETELHDGDRIGLRGRSSGRTAMQLTVNFIPLA